MVPGMSEWLVLRVLLYLECERVAGPEMVADGWLTPLPVLVAKGACPRLHCEVVTGVLLPEEIKSTHFWIGIYHIDVDILTQTRAGPLSSFPR